MNGPPDVATIRWIRGAVLIVILVGALSLWLRWSGEESVAALPPPLEPLPAEATAEQVQQICAGCHAVPSPDILPQRAWRAEVKRASGFLRDADKPYPLVDLEAVAAYFENRAPEELSKLPPLAPAAQPFPVKFQTLATRSPDERSAPDVLQVQVAQLDRAFGTELIVCQRDPGHIWAVRCNQELPVWRRLATLIAPAHVEVVDLDADGHLDLVVADLGRFLPTDDRVGRVVWLRNQQGQGFEPVVLLDGVGRVSDVRAGDFNTDGRLDLIVAAFGWQTSGSVLYLENRSTDWSRPQFDPQTLDSRSGVIHAPIGDLNGDGHLDVVTLISQGTEAVFAQLGQGNGKFRQETIYTAPSPTYGSSGIQLVDLDRDQDLDVLYTNGDTLDAPFILKPYHGLQWLENRGQFPFVHHPLLPMHGAMQAVAADIDADGDEDIFAVSFLAEERFGPELRRGLPAAVLLEQTAPRTFRPTPLETSTCDHLTCAAGDLFGSGRLDLIAGNLFTTGGAVPRSSISVWRNLGAVAPTAPK